MLSDSIYLPLYFTTTRARQQLSWAAMLAHLSSRVFEFLVETFGTSESKRKEKNKETQEREVFRARMSHLWLGERAWIWAKRSGEITGVWNWETVRSPIPAKKKFMYSIYIYMFIFKYIYIYYVCVCFFSFLAFGWIRCYFVHHILGKPLDAPRKKYTVPFIVIVIVVFSLCRDAFTKWLGPAIPKSQLHYKQKHCSLSSNHTDKSSISWELIVSQPYLWEKSILNKVNPKGKVPSWYRR